MAGDPPRDGARAGDDMPLRGSSEPLASRYDVALLDLDGVVYLGGSPIPGAADALAKAAASGMRLAFVTNNASRTPSAIAAQLTGLGVPASPDEVITSAQAAARLLAEHLPAGAPVLVVGGMGLRIAVRERGFRPVTVAADQPGRRASRGTRPTSATRCWRRAGSPSPPARCSSPRTRTPRCPRPAGGSRATAPSSR